MKQLRGIPAELMNEIFGSMPLENASSLLAKMPNGLLARNIKKMINAIKEAMKNNKWNEEDCGSKLAISEDGLIIKHSGPSVKLNCVRSTLPIPEFNLIAINKPKITCYFEIEILNISNWFHPITIGFCNQQFPLEGNWLGYSKNTIGYGNKYRIWINENFITFENDHAFKKGNCVGIGIIHCPNGKMECFSTWNVKVELPTKIVNIQLFIAINMEVNGDSIRVNYGKDKWQFKDFGLVLE